MDGLVLSDLDNSTDGLTDGEASTVATSTAWRNVVGQSVSAKAPVVLGLIIGIVSVVTNSAVLAVLVRARRQFGSSVHTLITNQCAADLFTSVFFMSTLVLMVTHGYHYMYDYTILLGGFCFLGFIFRVSF